MKTVWVVEDDDVYRRALARALRREGFAPVEVAGVEAAHRIMAEGDPEAGEAPGADAPDYAVVDLALGDGSGIDVVRLLAAEAPGCRSVLLTANGTIPAAVEAMRSGAVDFRTKPISTAELVDTLRRADTFPRAGLPDDLDDAEHRHIRRILEESGGSVSEAARRLGLHRRTLQRKLQKIHPTR